ncbi:hypothetical protein CW751_00360 [Brumimicrobium salinarum]|uniref:DUF4252 domain-containing protein n=1 Tax=Brumimicrobium salinarum TaxID=2058658 RepID=A0A2I0R5G5_9FLAO|nr:hypothetical protein [Brumimicrobium salinarum]PKR81827.1 hypothetical protein CW751_00360 [Brumimicrobium salinarum]
MKYFYIAFIGLAFLISSCASFNKQLYSGEITRDLNSNYSNDSIHFYVDLAGDHVRNKKKKDLKRQLKTYNIKPFKNNVIEYFETIIDPYYDVFLFQFANEKAYNKFLEYKNFEHVDFDEKTKKTIIKDSSQFVYGIQASQTDGSSILLLSYVRAKNVDDYQLMLKEYEGVVGSFKVEEGE